MKKLSLSIGCLLFTALVISSCSSQEVAVNKTEPLKIEKTNEMLQFESSLKAWMQTNPENSKNPETSKKQQAIESQIATDAKTLLLSIGVNENEFTAKNTLDIQTLVDITLEAYSKKLTQMYNEQKNKK